MWRHKSALLLMSATVCLAARTDSSLNKSLGSCSSMCKTACAIARDPNNLQVPPQKSCVIYQDPEDFTLNIGTLRLSAHMKVLAGSILYFEDSSTTVLSKKQALIDKDLDPNAVKALFRYAYTRKVKINTKNAEPLLKAAQFLQIQNVISICCDFIISRMSPNNRPDRQICKSGLRGDRFVKLTWGTPNQLIQMYAPSVRKLEYAATSPNKRNFAVLLHNSLLYAIGGIDSRSVDVYNPVTNSWSSIAPMLEIRSEAAAAVRKGIIYVSGGFQRVVGGLTSTEAYSRHTNSWKRLAPMERQRWGHRLVVIDHSLYAIGGYNDIGLRSVEIYDKTLNKWTMGKPMLRARKNFGAALHRGKLYVCGGEGSVGQLAEVFDPDEQSWTALAKTNRAESINSMVSYQDKLYAFGREDVYAEVYDPETDLWTHEVDVFDYDEARGEIVVLNYDKMYHN